MKNVDSAMIVDEMIDRLKQVKSGQSERFIVEQLYVVRAYCDLLIKTFEKNAPLENREMTTTSNQSVSDVLDDEQLDTILDF